MFGSRYDARQINMLTWWPYWLSDAEQIARHTPHVYRCFTTSIRFLSFFSLLRSFRAVILICRIFWLKFLQDCVSISRDVTKYSYDLCPRFESLMSYRSDLKSVLTLFRFMPSKLSGTRKHKTANLEYQLYRLICILTLNFVARTFFSDSFLLKRLTLLIPRFKLFPVFQCCTARSLSFCACYWSILSYTLFFITPLVSLLYYWLSTVCDIWPFL